MFIEPHGISSVNGGGKRDIIRGWPDAPGRRQGRSRANVSEQRQIWRAGIALAALLAVGGCHGTESAPPAAAPERVTRVEVLKLEPARVEDWLDLPGSIEPEQEVTVGAEVGGLLEWRGPKEGDRVAKGARLALVDRERLALAEWQAALALEQ